MTAICATETSAVRASHGPIRRRPTVIGAAREEPLLRSRGIVRPPGRSGRAMASLACPVCCLILNAETPARVALVAKPALRLWPECEHALELDRNLALAHAVIGLGKCILVVPRRRKPLAPRPYASVRVTHSLTCGCTSRGWRGFILVPTIKRSRDVDDRLSPTATSRRPFFTWAPRSRIWAGLTRRARKSAPPSRSTRISRSSAISPTSRATTPSISPSANASPRACAWRACRKDIALRPIETSTSETTASRRDA